MRSCPTCKRRYPDSISFCPEDGSHLQDLEQSSEVVPEKSKALDNKEVGAYRLEEVLAEGGMGVIFQAEHVRLGRKVALKMLRPEFSGNKRAITRFFREARAVNEIRHDNIIEITDFIEDQDGENYYVMELLEGRSLKAVLQGGATLPVPRTLSIAMQICNALAAVHQAGIVHRDLKSENVFLTSRHENPDFVKLLDFGVAKMIRHMDDEPIHKTVEGTILGTAEYMSPEQASGKAVDFRTDIYALGVLLYEMVVGRKPITGKNFSEVIFNQMTIKPVPPSKLQDICISLPLHLEKIIMQCLEKDPERRPQSMEEIESRLRQVGQAGSVQCEVHTGEVPVVRRGPGLVALLGVGVVVVAGIAIGAGFLGQSRKEPAGEPRNETPPPAVDAGRPDSRAAPKASKIEIRFESAPPGAAIFRAGDDEPLGTTPARLGFDREERMEVFVFRLQNHRTERRDVSLDRGGQVSVIMKRQVRSAAAGGKKIRKPPVPGKKRKKKKKKNDGPGSIDLGGTVNPFEE